MPPKEGGKGLNRRAISDMYISRDEQENLAISKGGYFGGKRGFCYGGRSIGKKKSTTEL